MDEEVHTAAARARKDKIVNVRHSQKAILRGPQAAGLRSMDQCHLLRALVTIVCTRSRKVWVLEGGYTADTGTR